MLVAYLDAWSHVQSVDRLAPWQDAVSVGAWLALMGFLGVLLTRNLAAGTAWRSALPSGYHQALIGGVVFGLGALADGYYLRAFSFGPGIEALLAPTRLAEVAGGGLMVSAPLSQALRAGVERVGWPVVLSSGLTLSALGFVTLYANPLVEPFPSYVQILMWQDQSLGTVAIAIQTSMLTGMMLLLAWNFELPRGSLTVLCAVYGFLGAMVKPYFELFPLMLLTGVAADGLLFWLKRDVYSARRLYTFSACVPVVYTLLYWVSIAALFPGGSWWSPQLWVGVASASALAGCLVCSVTGIRQPRSAAALAEVAERRPRRRLEVDPSIVKNALESLNDRDALAGSPLVSLRPGANGAAGPELRNLLIDVVEELAASREPRASEAGKVLRDYYVERSGSHEAIAARLHLSRPTVYRRRQQGFALVAERLEELAESPA